MQKHLIFLLTIVFVVSGSRAQEGNINEIRDQLLSLRGTYANVRYEPGTLNRASIWLNWLDPFARQVSKWNYNKTIIKTGVVLLDPVHWTEVTTLPYGLPVSILPGWVISPARPHIIVGEIWKILLAGWLPQLRIRESIQGGGEASRGIVASDIYSKFEIARSVVPDMGVLIAESWIVDLLGHIVYIAVNQEIGKDFREELKETDTFYSMLERGYGSTSKPLTLMPATVNPKDRLEWQPRLYRMAKRIVDKENSDRVVPYLIKISRKNEPLSLEFLKRKFKYLF